MSFYDYSVVIPSIQSTKKEFPSLRKAKKYCVELLEELPNMPDQPYPSIDSLPIVYQTGRPARYIRLMLNRRYDYTNAPPSWKS